MHKEMSPTERAVYETTAITADLIAYLHQRGALAVSETAAAAHAIEYLDQYAARALWPQEWRDHAHVDLLDMADG